MKKRARICLYIFLVCTLILLGIGGYFVFGRPSENVRVGKKFVTFNSVQDASSYVVSVEDQDGAQSQEVVYKIDKQDTSSSDKQTYEYKIDVFVDSAQVAKESYTQTIINENEENNTIDCVISKYTIFFLSTGESVIYPDQTLNGVDKNIFCCVVSEYFGDVFVEDGNYKLKCKSLNADGDLIEEAIYDYDYAASYKEDFARRGEYYYDGEWYDYIIESKKELNAFVWYAILYRLGAEGDYSFYIDCKEITTGNINNLVINAINEYPEYDALEDSYTYAKMEGNIGYLTNFNYYLNSDFLLTYKDTKKLDKTSNKRNYNKAMEYVHQKDDDFFQGYITYVEEAQEEEPLLPEEAQQEASVGRTFKINNAQNEVVVYNTEQLFMVVQSGAKPKFADNSSVVKKVYDNALAVAAQINNSDKLTDFEKVTNIYRYITGQIVYDYALYAFMELTNNYTIKTFGNFSSFYLEGVFYDFEGLDCHYAVCDGLSKAFVLLCNIEGIKCIKVNGVVNSGNHAWNKVYLQEGDLDGWYYVDTTWGEGEYDDKQILTHTYFLFDIAEGKREINYPNNIELVAPSGHADYYQLMQYTYQDESANYYIESDEELSHVLSYAQSKCDENDNYVIELEFKSTYMDSSSSKIYELIDLQKQIDECESKLERENDPFKRMQLQSKMQNLKIARTSWFGDNGVSSKYEWLQMGNIIIFRIYK